MLDLTELTSQVTRLRTVREGVIALITKLKENAGDPVALKQLVDQFAAEQDQIASAVEANTPGAPTPA